MCIWPISKYSSSHEYRNIYEHACNSFLVQYEQYFFKYLCVWNIEKQVCIWWLWPIRNRCQFKIANKQILTTESPEQAEVCHFCLMKLLKWQINHCHRWTTDVANRCWSLLRMQVHTLVPHVAVTCCVWKSSALISTQGTIQQHYTSFNQPRDNTVSNNERRRCRWYLFPERFANVGVCFADVTSHYNSVVGQSQGHVQSVVACVHSCNERGTKISMMDDNREGKYGCSKLGFHTGRVLTFTWVTVSFLKSSFNHVIGCISLVYNVYIQSKTWWLCHW